MILAQLSDVPWQAHPEVWLMTVSAVGLGFYASRVVQPTAVAAGFDPISRGQKLWYAFAVVGMWLASDWPVHDIAEEHLYFVHMFQHLFISMLIPAAFVMATPRWMIDLLVPEGTEARRGFRWITAPLRAGLIFNALTILLHWSFIVEVSAASGAAHFMFHLGVFVAGLFMWMPICGPIPEWQLSAPGKMIFLFLMSIVPTIPSGWLIFSENVVYRPYDTPNRLWGIDVLSDQQAAGVVMKLVGGFFLWGVIVVIFARWSAAEQRKQELERKARRASRLSDLTTGHVGEAFARSEPRPEPT